MIETDQQTAQDESRPQEGVPHTVTIGGREITVRPINFIEGLELAPVLGGMLNELDDAVGDGSDLSGLLDVLYANPAVLRRLLEISAGVDEAFIDGLNAEEGDALALTVWTVNAGFFLRRILLRRMARLAGKAPQAPSESEPEND